MTRLNSYPTTLLEKSGILDLEFFVGFSNATI